jgi:hypothetical protein
MPATKRFSIDPARRTPIRILAGTLVVLSIAIPAVMLVFARYALPAGSPRLVLGVAAGVLGLILVAVALFALFLVRRIALELGPDGILYRQVGYSVRAAWADVIRIGLVPAGVVYVEGLVLRDARVEGARWARRFVRIGRQDLAIPLTLFSWRWRDDDLGAAIREYRPDLVGE